MPRPPGLNSDCPYSQLVGFATQYGLASSSVIVIGNNTPGLRAASDPAAHKSARTPKRWRSSSRRPCKNRFAWRSYYNIANGTGVPL